MDDITDDNDVLESSLSDDDLKKLVYSKLEELSKEFNIFNSFSDRGSFLLSLYEFVRYNFNFYEVSNDKLLGEFNLFIDSLEITSNGVKYGLFKDYNTILTAFDMVPNGPFFRDIYYPNHLIYKQDSKDLGDLITNLAESEKGLSDIRSAEEVRIVRYFGDAEDRFKALLAVRTILPELLIMTSKYHGLFTRSKRLKHYSSEIIMQPPFSFYKLYKNMRSYITDRPALVALSLNGGLSINFIDPTPSIANQRDELIAVNGIVEHIVGSYNMDEDESLCPQGMRGLEKRWNYAMAKKGKDFISHFPQRREYWETIFNELNKNRVKIPEKFAENLGL